MSMNVIKWNDFNSTFPSIFSAFDDFGRDYFAPLSSGISRPAMNIKECANTFLLSLAVPGLEKEDCKIQVQGGVLTISSQKEQKKESTGEQTRYEYNFSSFTRSFALPKNVNIDAISAEYTNGELKVSLPKKEVETSNTKEVPIR